MVPNNIPVNAYTSGANIPVMPLSNTNYSLVSVTDANIIQLLMEHHWCFLMVLVSGA